MARFTQDRMYEMLGEISKQQKRAYRTGGLTEAYYAGEESDLIKFAKGGRKKRKQEYKPGEWANVEPELVEPGSESFDLPTSPSIPQEIKTHDCPIFHKYDPSLGKCVPFTEEEKAAYSLEYMRNWTKSPMHEEMLRASIEKDAPVGDIDSYVKNITDLRLRATDPYIKISGPSEDNTFGDAQPFDFEPFINGKPVITHNPEQTVEKGKDEGSVFYKNSRMFDPTVGTAEDLENYKKFNSPLYLTSGINNANFLHYNYSRDAEHGDKFKFTGLYTKNDKTLDKFDSYSDVGKTKIPKFSTDLKRPANFYTKGLPGDHSYVYAHEFSHLNDAGGDLMPHSDKKLIASWDTPEWKELGDKFYDKSWELHEAKERGEITQDEYDQKISDLKIDAYLQHGGKRYDVDKDMYENNFEKFKVQRGYDQNLDNSLSFDDFVKKNKTKLDVFGAKSYIGMDTETRARLNAIRMYGQAAGIYDPFTEKLTPEKYQKLLELHKTQNIDSKDANQLRQLKEVFSDEEILNLLNTISKNEPQRDTESDMEMAKRGGQYSKKTTLLNKFFRK